MTISRLSKENLILVHKQKHMILTLTSLVTSSLLANLTAHSKLELRVTVWHTGLSVAMPTTKSTHHGERTTCRN